MPPSLALGILLAALVSLAGYSGRALTAPGALAATAIGAIVLAGVGWAGGLGLGVFFAGSSLVSRMTEARTKGWPDAKGTRRDAVQVWANGGTALAGGFVGFLDAHLGLWIVTASLAAAAADTWATSLGALSRRPPVLISTGRPASPGTSGAVSLAGTLGAALGAALTAGAVGWMDGSVRLALGATAIGFGGMLADSAIGATLQARFHCPACGTDGERPIHACGEKALHTEGIRWLDNDVVNAIATVTAGVAGFVTGSWSVPSG